MRSWPAHAGPSVAAKQMVQTRQSTSAHFDQAIAVLEFGQTTRGRVAIDFFIPRIADYTAT